MTKTASKPKVVHNLPSKKTLKVVPSGVHSTLYKIVYHEGGNVPKELSSSYNKKSVANRLIKDYIENNRSYLDHVRDKDNAKSKDKDRE